MNTHAKRLAAVLLVMVMVFIMTPASNVAGKTAPVRLNVVTSGRLVGDTLKVTVEATEANAIADGKLSISYDGNVLQYLSDDAGSAWAVTTGIINGIDGSLKPHGTATRAQIAAMIMRFETSNEN